MSELFLPAEFAAMFMALVVPVLGVLYAFPRTFRLRSPGSRVAGLRLLVGAIVAVDASLQFLPGAPPQVAYLLVVGAGQDQPTISWWFSYWAGVIGGDPGLWWYGTGILTAALATCLILGVARRLAYVVGFLFGLMLWAVPNGFGGPYAAPNTDVGAGLLYAVLFLMLLQMDSVSGPARWTGDAALERRWPGWRWLGGPAFHRWLPKESPREEETRTPHVAESPPSIRGPASERRARVTDVLPREWAWDTVSAGSSPARASSATGTRGSAGKATRRELER